MEPVLQHDCESARLTSAFTLPQILLWLFLQHKIPLLGKRSPKCNCWIYPRWANSFSLCFPFFPVFALAIGIWLGTTDSLITRQGKLWNPTFLIKFAHLCFITVLLEVCVLDQIPTNGYNKKEWWNLIRTWITINRNMTAFQGLVSFKVGESLWILEYRKASCGGRSSFGNLLEICVVCKKRFQGLQKKLSWLEAAFCNLKIIFFLFN